MANEETDLPDPDSPTIPKISFVFKVYDMLCITSFSPKEIDKLLIFKIMFVFKSIGLITSNILKIHSCFLIAIVCKTELNVSGFFGWFVVFP